MICLNCKSEFEYPKVLDDDIGSVMAVCPICGSPDISIDESQSVFFHRTARRAALSSQWRK